MKKFKEKVNPEKGVCAAEGCSNIPKGNRKLCNTHRSQLSRLKDPVRYAYNNLRTSANRRGIFFDLTYDQFSEFCYETEYLDKRGRSKGGFNVDRITEGKTPGYTKDNIQCLEKTKNIKKYFAYNEITRKTEFIYAETKKEPKEDLPF